MHGEIQFTLPLAPVSQQASPEAKAKFKTAILNIVQPLEYILTGDVQIEIEWLIREQIRYELDISPDIDNIYQFPS